MKVKIRKIALFKLHEGLRGNSVSISACDADGNEVEKKNVKINNTRTAFVSFPKDFKGDVKLALRSSKGDTRDEEFTV